jgi:hypothetical protein
MSDVQLKEVTAMELVNAQEFHERFHLTVVPTDEELAALARHDFVMVGAKRKPEETSFRHVWLHVDEDPEGGSIQGSAFEFPPGLDLDYGLVVPCQKVHVFKILHSHEEVTAFVNDQSQRMEEAMALTDSADTFVGVGFQAHFPRPQHVQEGDNPSFTLWLMAEECAEWADLFRSHPELQESYGLMREMYELADKLMHAGGNLAATFNHHPELCQDFNVPEELRPGY